MNKIDTTTSPKGGWIIAVLLFFFMLINFVDKAVIGLAGVPIMQELNLTPKQFGLVNASFFFLFSLSAIVTGFVVNRVQSRFALLVMALIWALTQFPMVGSVSLASLMACRIVLGAGEGPAYPVAMHATYKWFPDALRTLPTAIISQGASIGVVVAIPLLNYVIVHYSWHWAFGLLGVVGLIWTIAWLFLGREGTIDTTVTHGAGRALDHVPYAQLLLNGTVLSTVAAAFGAYWGLSLLVGWFTPYLIQGLGFAQTQASLITALPWAATPVVVIAASWLSQRLLLRGATSRAARGLFGGGSVALGGLALIAMPFLPGTAAKIAMMVAGISVPAVIYVMSQAVISEITPVAQRGAVLAITTALATSAGLLGPYIMGSVVQEAIASGASIADGYAHGFMICGIVALICGLIGAAFMRPQAEAARFVMTGRIAAAPLAAE